MNVVRWFSSTDANQYDDKDEGLRKGGVGEDAYPLLATSEHSPHLSDDTLTHEAEGQSWRSIRLKGLTDNWAVVDPLNHNFNPSIEGLRGIAVCLTMICHIIDQPYGLREVMGSMGVTIFFVLSGFLITAVLIRAKSRQKSTFGHLPRFYADRFFRLAPALVLLVAVICPFHYWAGHDMKNVGGYGLLALFSMSNWPSLRPEPWSTGPFGNTWSLACEEQFYFVWPMLLPFLLARRVAVRFVIIASVVCFLIFIRLYTSAFEGSFGGTDWRFGLWAHVWKMIIGSSLRLIPTPTFLLRRIWAYIGLLGLAATLLFVQYVPEYDYKTITPAWDDHSKPMLAWTDMLSAFFTSVLLCGLSGEQGGLRILELGPVRFLGRISYSWYLWQIPILSLSGWHRVYPAIGDTAIAFVVSMCSTIYVEEPINCAYKRWKARRDAPRSIV